MKASIIFPLVPAHSGRVSPSGTTRRTGSGLSTVAMQTRWRRWRMCRLTVSEVSCAIRSMVGRAVSPSRTLRITMPASATRPLPRTYPRPRGSRASMSWATSD